MNGVYVDGQDSLSTLSVEVNKATLHVRTKYCN